MVGPILFIIDPPEKLAPSKDTSLALMREHQRRGDETFACTVSDLDLTAGSPRARAHAAFFLEGAAMYRQGEPVDLKLDRCAIVHMRKDPPVDTAYLHATYILDRLPPSVLQVNPARALRAQCEKLVPLYFPDLAPETIVSASVSRLLTFLKKEQRIVIKPLNDCSAHGIFLLERKDPEAERKLAEATAEGGRHIIAQAYLPSAPQGDLRVLLLCGEVLGCLRRIPQTGDFRSNLNAGGHYQSCEMTEEARQICDRLGPWLDREGIYLAGLDLMEGKILEVNITSPSCLCEINEVTGQRLEERVIDTLTALSRQRR